MGDTSTWRNSRVTKLLLLFIESGALFLVIQLFALVGELGNMLDTTGAFILVAEVASAFLNIFSVSYLYVAYSESTALLVQYGTRDQTGQAEVHV